MSLKLSINFLTVIFASCLVSCQTNNYVHTKDKDYPDVAIRPNFKVGEQDSLQKLMAFDVLSNDSESNVIGFISSINFNSDYIYISDDQQNKIFVLDRKTFTYLFSIGHGPGKAPSDLNRPFGLQVLSDRLMVPHGRGQFFAGFYTFNGEFIDAISRKSFEYFGSLDRSFLLKGDTAYTTIGIARNHKKVQVFDLYKQEVEEILEVSDFHSTADTTLEYDKVVPTLFLSASATDPSIFYAVPGTKPLVNSYDMNGKLLNSYDLRSIPILNTYYTQQKDLFHDPASEGGFIYSYFTGVINDGNDNLIFACQEILDLQKIGDNFEGLGDPDNVRNYYVFVNPMTKTYKLFKCEFAFMPMKVIDGNLWCFDMTKSAIVVYRLPEY